ncbi:hypothetical protein KJ359_000973 [Pestalotiopsis sp. 9143b]|nr:hypothetical protein KJ359_000973 [Pestalotiopsis sp. 9143b]
MSYMVSEYIIRPALQQVRRFSRSSIRSETDTPSSPGRPKDYPASRDDAISETEGGSFLKDGDESTSPPASSRSSLIPQLDFETIEPETSREPPVLSQIPSNAAAQDPSSVGSGTDPASTAESHTTTRERDTSDVSMTSAPAADGEDPRPAGAATSATPATEGPDPLPEDDGMGALRKRIIEIQARQLPAADQARLVHLVLMESYKKSRAVFEEDRPVSPSSSTGWEQKQTQGVLDTFIWNHLLGEEAPSEKFHLTEDDVRPTFAPLKSGEEESEYRALGKSIVNMETQFRRLDIAIETQPMPEKFQDTRALISCNDCSAKTTVKYHWLGLKCAVCQSYNTSQVQILGEDDTRAVAPAAVPDPQVPESLVSSNADMLQSSTASVPRDIPRRRRHSSNLMQLSTDNLNPRPAEIGSYIVQERFARSVSPTAANPSAGDMDDSDEDKEDMIGFWRRVPRSITSNDEEEEEDDYDSDDDSVSSIADDMDEDDAEDEEDEINLFGHR